MALVQPTPFKTSASNTYTANRLRRVLQSAIVDGEGVLGPSDMTVAADSPASMRVRVGAGRAWVAGDSATRQGAYLIENDATQTTPFATAAHATLYRRDLLVLRVHDAAADGGSDSSDLDAFEIVVGGTGATYAAAAAPAVPANAIPLCELQVNPAATTVIVGDDRRPLFPFESPGANLLGNPQFDEWSRGTTTAPDGWSHWGTVAQIAGPGVTFAAQLTNTASQAGQLYQFIDATGFPSMAMLYKRPITFVATVLASTASRVRLNINDGGSGNYLSGYHSGGGGWETLQVTGMLTGTAGSKPYVQLLIETGTSIVAGIARAGLFLGERGPVKLPTWRQPALDMLFAGRVYERGNARFDGYQSAGASVVAPLQYQTRKAGVPTVTYSGVSNTGIAAGSYPQALGASKDGHNHYGVKDAATGGFILSGNWDAVV